MKKWIPIAWIVCSLYGGWWLGGQFTSIEKDRITVIVHQHEVEFHGAKP